MRGALTETVAETRVGTTKLLWPIIKPLSLSYLYKRESLKALVQSYLYVSLDIPLSVVQEDDVVYADTQSDPVVRRRSRLLSIEVTPPSTYTPQSRPSHRRQDNN